MIGYPNGDVPRETGVCADVIIRAVRDALGVDLQKLVHDDMARHFSAYPREWGLRKPDKNIDHRRVRNLEAWFRRHKMILPLSKSPADYQPGDFVGWQCGGLWHVGIVAEEMYAEMELRPVIHNIGIGTRCEALLYDFAIGDFRCRLSWHARWQSDKPPNWQ